MEVEKTEKNITEENESKVIYRGWKVMPFIIGNETFEKLGIVGSSSNLVIYLTTVFNMKSITAAKVVNIYGGTSNFGTIVAAFLCDSYFGRYKTLSFAMIACFLGSVAMDLTAVFPQLHPAKCAKEIGSVCNGPSIGQIMFLAGAMVLLVIGAGGIRPCNLPFGADQFDPKTKEGKRGIESFFNWYFFTFTFAQMVSLTLIVYVQSNVSWSIGLAIPAILMLLGCIIFFAGSKLYVKVKASGSPIHSITRVIVVAIKKRRLKPVGSNELYNYIGKDFKNSKLGHTEQFRHLFSSTLPLSINFSDEKLKHQHLITTKVVGRLLRFWDARNIKKDGQFMGIVLLLLDEKCAVIHAFIPSALASQFRQILREGSIYNFSGFEVGRCTKLYKITDHPFLLRFLPATTIVELSDVGPTIEREKFMLRNFDNLQALANTNIELPDVVGQISFIQGSNLNDPTSTQRLVLRYRIDTSVIVYLSLWDDVAATFRAHLSSGDTINSVMLITTVNPKMFGGNLYLNSTSATRFFFDTSIQPIQEFIERMGIKSEEAIARADTAAGIRKKELVSIHQLHEFISKTDEQTQDADFLCNAKVLSVLQKNGWSYVSCTGCSRKLDKVGNVLRCSKCVSSSVTGVVKYRVELGVHDGHDEATFVVFDNEMTKLTTKTAATLILENGNEGTRDEIPSCIEDLTGKQFLFQIKVTPFNFSSKHRTFTVSKLSEAYTDCSQTEITKGGPTFNLDLEGTTSSNIARSGQDTLDKEYEKVTTSNVGTVEKSRKRGRE